MFVNQCWWKPDQSLQLKINTTNQLLRILGLRMENNFQRHHKKE